jgi:succinyl-CoA synthetase beta subunit
VDGQLIAADAKLGFDDNAAYRQKEIFDTKDESQIDPRYVVWWPRDAVPALQDGG